MSNVASTSINNKNRPHPHMPPMPGAERQIVRGSRDMLDEARGVVEQSVGQGQMLNPLIYQMLGLEPQYEDHTADLQASQQELDGAQNQFNEGQKTLDMLKAIPQRRRTPDQRRQLHQIKKQLPKLNRALEDAKDKHGQLMTSPKTITGLGRMDPSQIPAESPFSPQNPLNQAQRTEQERLNQYLSGSLPVDPTLVHQYDQAEASLRGKLADRFGPDYESTSVGQQALQNFGRQKNEAYATWNQQMVGQYQQMAFGGAADLQKLLAGQIGLYREPEQTGLGAGTQLSNLVGQRLSEQQGAEQRGRDIATGGTGAAVGGGGSAAPLIQGGLGALGGLMTTPYDTGKVDAAGKPVTTTLTSEAVQGVTDLAKWAGGGIESGASYLWNLL